MKKSTKLLSIFLAVLMILSTLTVGAFAAKTNYKTVANLESLGAYSPYGTVTRLSTEERVSILFDWLDHILAGVNIYMGEVANINTVIAGKLYVYIDLRSVDGLCETIDSIKGTQGTGAWAIADTFVDLGSLQYLTTDSWSKGIRRSNTAQATILFEVLELLATNTNLIDHIFAEGLKLGIISNFAKDLDVSEINAIITNLPSLFYKLLYPLFSRPDDTAAATTTLKNKRDGAGSASDLVTTLNSFVKGLFTKPMSWTSYRVDVDGNDLHYTEGLPTTAQGTARYFSQNNDKITQYDYDFETGAWNATVTYTKEAEFPGSDTYVFRAPKNYDGDATLKWYKAGDEGYWLPSVRDAMTANTLTIDVNGNDTVMGLVYKFAPYLFREMAVVVLNGSVKKLVAELFGVKFTKIGDRDPKVSPSVIKDKDGNTVTGLPNDSFFTDNQEFYIWEYTDYKVIDGVPYYRYQEEYFKGELPLDLSAYYWMFNWNYKITGDWADEFIPTADGSNSPAGYPRILQALNDFVGKAINTFILPTWESKGVTYTRDDIFAWTAGDLSKLPQNILNVARKVFMIAPEQIVDDYYMEAQFYDAMMTGTLKQAVNGLICEVVKLLMPQMTWPDNVINQDMLSIAAMVVRELITDLMPSYNYDALIYADYNNRALLEGKDKEYWTNVTLTMGIDLGLYYLRNLADLGEDKPTSYYTVMNTLGAIPSSDAETMTYPADFDVAKWTYKIDWLLDWALGTEEWNWNMNKLVNVTGAVNISTYQDPWAKLNSAIMGLLPLDQLLNDSGVTTTSETFLENILRGKLVNAVSELDFQTLISIFDVPAGYFRNKNILDQAVKLVVKIVNNVTHKVMNNTDLFNTSTFSSVTALFNQTNLKNLVTNLIGNLTTLYNKGLLDAALPIVGIFLGWKTDPQEYSDPSISLLNINTDDKGVDKDSGLNYWYTGSTKEVLRVANDSAGMLLKHRNSTVTDSNYVVKICSVTSNDGTISTTGLPKTLNPWDTVDLKLSSSSTTARAVQVIVGYQFYGKDGQLLGKENEYRYKAMMVYYSGAYDDGSTVRDEVGRSDKFDSGAFSSNRVRFYREAYNKTYIVKPEDDISVVNDFIIVLTSDQNNSQWVKSAEWSGTATNLTRAANSTFVHGTSEQASLKNKDHGWMAASGQSEHEMHLHLFTMPSGVTSFTSGTKYTAGSVNITVCRSSKASESTGAMALPTFYCYDIFDNLKDAYNNNKTININQIDTSKEGAQAAFDSLMNYLKQAARIVEGPLDLANISMYTEANQTAIANNINTAVELLESEGYYVRPTADDQKAILQTALNTAEDVETKGYQDYDFADHKLFEYFQYEKQRTNTREMISGLTAPTAPTKYIEGEGISAEQIDAIVAAKSGKELLGINNTIINPTQDQLDQFAADLLNWRAAYYDDVNVANQAKMLLYYKQFMAANPRDVSAAYQDQFLNKEIEYAQAQNYVESDYTADTWAVYADALANAQAVAAATSLPSVIFDAKYELMMAQHDLLKISRSMKEDGENYLDKELTGLIANAEVILANSQYYDVVAGMTEADAFGQLVRALGVRYTNLDGDDAILYDHSAYTFVDYDRADTTKNRTKVDFAADKLEAAINNFVCNVVIESTDANVISDVETDVKLIMGVLPGAINSLNDLLNYVSGSVNEAVLTPAASAANLFGTGATVTLSIPAVGDLAIYKVVIFGDVDGDGAIDAYDLFNVDKAQFCGLVLDGVYKTAADISADDTINLADYTAIKDDVAGIQAIDQTPNA